MLVQTNKLYYEMNYTEKPPECELSSLFLELSKALNSFWFNGTTVTYEHSKHQLSVVIYSQIFLILFQKKKNCLSWKKILIKKFLTWATISWTVGSNQWALAQHEKAWWEKHLYIILVKNITAPQSFSVNYFVPFSNFSTLKYIFVQKFLTFSLFTHKM
jgi:hypothetical protein